MLKAVTLAPTLESEEMAKPASNYLAKAVPVQGGSGFYAQWAAPGMIPDWVYDGKAPRVFAQQAAAEIAAMRVMFDALNTRRRSRSKQEISRKMSGSEFAIALAEANIGPTLWAQIWGSKPDRIIDQMDGGVDVPFPARWVLELLKNPENLRTAIAITADNIDYREDFIKYLRESGQHQAADDIAQTRIPVEMTGKKK